MLTIIAVISQIYYCGQISLKSAEVNCSFSDNLTPLGGNIYFAGNGTSVKIKMNTNISALE